MKIIYLLLTLLILYATSGCRGKLVAVAHKSMTIEAPHEIYCENMFVVGDMLVLINNSGSYFFDYYKLPDLIYLGSFGRLSRDIDGFSMVPSPDLIRIVSDSSFVSDNRIITFTESNKVKVSSFTNSAIIRNKSIDSILNSRLSSSSKMYARSDLIDGKIYSLLYTIKDNNLQINNNIPELHLFDVNYNLLEKFALSHPLITFGVSNKYNKIYTLSADNYNQIQVYDSPFISK